jgi:hypothetical protein
MDTMGVPEPPPPVLVGVGVGVVGVGVGVGDPLLPLQVVPLRVKAVGAVLVPV